MEENVALDATKQKKFIKSIKGIKKLIKKNENVKPEEGVTPKVKKEKFKRKRPERGLVYLSHIPHGFYEHEMTQYFKQFGMVTNVRVIRSKRTGNSKGYAFVEFKEPTVGEIVAETMNNYLMGKRLIKAAYIPPEKQKPKALRKHWSRLNNPGRDARLKLKKKHNENKDDKGDLKRARKILSNINKTKKKLSELGISYDFFTPVDVPEALQNSLNSNENVETSVKDSIVKVDKNAKKKKVSYLESNDNKSKKNKVEEIQAKPEKNKKAVKGEGKNESTAEVDVKKPDLSKNKNKKNKEPEPVVNKKEQKQKQQKLKEAGVKSVESFIKVQEESGDSDSSLAFDSDEYEKMLEDDSGDDSDIDDDSEVEEGSDGDKSEALDEDDDESDEEEEIVPPPKKSKCKPTPIVALPQKQGKKQKAPAPPQAKRKVPQKAASAPVSPKKPKFEKQTQQPMKKHFKKKKKF